MNRQPDLFGRHTVTIEEAAALLGVSRNTAYQAAKTGQLETIQIGRRKLVPTAHLRKALGLAAPPRRVLRPPSGSA